MKVIVLNDALEISKEAAEIIVNQVNKKHGSVIGFATGASPVETYKRIIEAYEKGDVSLNGITNSEDLTLLRQYLIGINNITSIDSYDIVKDSKINIVDLIRLKKILSGIA